MENQEFSQNSQGFETHRSRHIQFKNIEKVDPIILFAFFLLLLTTLFPLFFISPLHSFSSPFQTTEISGSVDFEIHNNIIYTSLVITNMTNNSLVAGSSGLSLLIRINSEKTYYQTYSFVYNDSAVYPIVMKKLILLDNSSTFISDFKIHVIAEFISSYPNTNVQFSTDAIIGRFDFPLLEKWFIITFVSSVALFTYALVSTWKKTPGSVKELLLSIRKKDFTKYEAFLANLNDNTYSILFMAPVFAIVSLLTLFYLHYSILTSILAYIYPNILNIIILIYLHALLILHGPTLFEFLYDDVKGDRLLIKTRTTNNILFYGFPILFYSFSLLFVIILPYEAVYLIVCILAFVFNSIIYFISFTYHSQKYNYNFSSKKIILGVLVSRIAYSVILLVLIQSLLLSDIPFPIILLII